MEAHTPPAGRSHFQSIAPIVVFDTAGPLLLYAVLRGAGEGKVASLIISGVLPAFSVLLTIRRDRRLDVIGALVLLGIAVSAILGLATGNARLVLLEGSVPTALFGAACVVSLLSTRPLMFRFALEFIGRETAAGREFAGRWRYALFRRTFKVMTIVWGVAYLVEAGVRVVIVENESAGTALSISKLLPYLFLALLIPWTMAYGKRSRRKGEAHAAAAAAAAAADR